MPIHKFLVNLQCFDVILELNSEILIFRLIYLKYIHNTYILIFSSNLNQGQGLTSSF